MPILSIFRRRHDPVLSTGNCTAVFIDGILEDSDASFTIFRQPSRKLSSGMPLILMSMSMNYPPLHTRLGQITAAEPGYITFSIRDEYGRVTPVRVPSDWVRLKFWEKIRYRRAIRTPESFVTPMHDTQSEADLPTAPTSHAISRLCPSISMFELNVHPLQED